MVSSGFRCEGFDYALNRALVSEEVLAQALGGIRFSSRFILHPQVLYASRISGDFDVSAALDHGDVFEFERSDIISTPLPPTALGASVPPMIFGAMKNVTLFTNPASTNSPATVEPPSTRTLCSERLPSSCKTADPSDSQSRRLAVQQITKHNHRRFKRCR